MLKALSFLTGGGGGIGTVTNVSIVSANGFAGTVADASTTPAITLTTSITGILKGNGTAISAATSGTDYSAGTAALATGILKSTNATGALTIAVAGDFPTLNQNTSGSAATVGTINGLISQGSNVTITGTGTSGSPYVINSSGTGGTPGGSDTEVQYNDAAAFAGDPTFNFNKTTKVLAATNFSGGGASLTSLTAANISAGTAGIDISGNAASVTVANEGTDATCFPLFVISATGSLVPKSNAALTYNSATGAFASTSFVGALTGNASTAAALQTARTIGGVSFNGTADITVASATGGFTVSGGALAVGANDITCTGSLGATGARLTKGWFTDLQVTNAIAGSVTGSAASATTATTLANARAIYGNNFDGSAALTQIIASTYGGTGNGFAKLSGPSSTEKTFTLPNASDTIACLGQVQAFSRQQTLTPQALTSTSNSIAWDANSGNNAKHTATENTTLANPSNMVDGTVYTFRWKQHASSAKTLAFGNKWKFAGSSTVSATVGSVQVFTGLYDSTDDTIITVMTGPFS